MRSSEPFDDEIPQEAPCMIANAISVLLDSAATTGEELLYKLALPVNELNQICGYSPDASPFCERNNVIQFTPRRLSMA